MQEVLIYITNDYADWEICHIGFQIKNSKKYDVKIISDTKDIVMSKGGLRVSPDYSIDEVANADITNFKMLVLCGGSFWRKGGFKNDELLNLIDKFHKNNITICSICDASTFLCLNGYFDNIPHTGNTLPYLKDNCPNYKGEKLFVEKQCVNADSIISANGTAGLDFAHEIFKKLEIMPIEDIEKWYNFYKFGYFQD